MGRPPAISTEMIVSAALGIIERDGFDELGMRGIGKELGVSAQALYHHVPTREALVSLLVEAVFRDITITDEPTWQATLRALGRSTWDAFSRYPGLLSGLPAHSSFVIGTEAARLAGAALELLTAEGFTSAESAHIWTATVALLAGELAFSADPAHELQAGPRALPDLVRDAAAGFTALGTYGHFDASFGVLLDGFEVLRRQRAPQRKNRRKGTTT